MTGAWETLELLLALVKKQRKLAFLEANSQSTRNFASREHRIGPVMSIPFPASDNTASPWVACTFHAPVSLIWILSKGPGKVLQIQSAGKGKRIIHSPGTLAENSCRLLLSPTSFLFWVRLVWNGLENMVIDSDKMTPWSKSSREFFWLSGNTGGGHQGFIRFIRFRDKKNFLSSHLPGDHRGNRTLMRAGVWGGGALESPGFRTRI